MTLPVPFRSIFSRRKRPLVQVVDQDEAMRIIDLKARRLLNMSLDEFRERAERGELPDTPAVDHFKFVTGVEGKV